MTWNGQSVIAVIPARGGSKGILRKNLRRVGDRSLIAWAAHCASQLSWLDAAVLSTDDEEMAEEGRRAGLSVPFMRPDDLATDAAGSAGMWQHAWLASEAHFGTRFEASILLQPTTPIRRAEDCTRTLQAVLDEGHRAATTISEVPGHFVPEKQLQLDEAGRIGFPQGGGCSRRQDAPKSYYRNGLCYALRRDTLIDDGFIVEDDCAGVLVDGFIVNIDDPIELELAEFLLQREQSEGRNEQ